MKNKGFTLVEMLAVIVLIALLASIAVGTYTRVNESAKKKTLETKIAEIKTAAEKWARENNITSRTSLSVNALVVEGYLTADENKVDQIAVIENPVTGKNMVCNVVEITFEKGEIVTKFNDTVENCKLASQSLVDTNISIKVIDSANIDRSGNATSSMAAWTSKDVMVVVSSTNYDPRATSISFDYEGNTTTYEKSGRSAYTGSAYLTKAQAASYYNVFHIDANLLLNSNVVVTYNIPNDTNKSRKYTIRIDKEEATATVKTGSEWVTADKPVNVMVDDGKGSGPRYFYVTTGTTFNSNMRYDAYYKGTSADLEVGTYYIWTEDNVGNRSSTYKAILEVNNVDTTEPTCELVFTGNVGNGGWYKEVPVTIKAKNSTPASISGVGVGVSTTASGVNYSAFAAYNTQVLSDGIVRNTNTTRTGSNYYCHVKSMAGLTGSGNRNLKLDMTPPVITLQTTSDTTYTKRKQVSVVVTDNLSGLNDHLEIEYQWVKDDGTSTGWKQTIYGNLSRYYTHTFLIAGGTAGDLTGTYDLWLRVVDVKDYAGNVADKINGTSGTATFGPFKFDGTPPVCDGVAGKTNWTSGEYSLSQDCRDDDGTTDQSGCVLATYPKSYGSSDSYQTDTITIADNAGNTTDCTVYVYLDNSNPVCGAATGASTSWTSSDRTISVACSDAYSGCTQSSYSDTWNTSTTTSSIQIADNVGHTVNCGVNVYVDKTNPSCSTNKTVKETTAGVGGTISCSDSHSGVNSCNGGSTSFSGLTTSQTYTVTDNVGHSATCSVTVTPYECNCYTHYGAWSGWASGVCTTSTSNTATVEYQSCKKPDSYGICDSDASAMRVCQQRTRSSWWACDDTCYK